MGEAGSRDKRRDDYPHTGEDIGLVFLQDLFRKSL